MASIHAETSAAAPLLEMQGIHKSYPGVHALRGVDLKLDAGEVLALLGENGAGKSTLIKILGGAHPPDAGSIRIDGRACHIASPVDAQRAGIAIIYQEFNLVPAFTAQENIFLGHEPSTMGFVRRRAEHHQTSELFGRIGVQINPASPCRDLPVAQQQVVEIAKALAFRARIIVMDEPSATLSLPEVERLLGIIRELAAQRMGVIYISHRLDEIFQVADQVMVLRDGEQVGTYRTGDVTRDELIERMVGRKLESEFPQRSCQIGEERLVVRHLGRAGKVHDVSFSARRGEVLGVTGLVGAGRTEMARLIFGADRPDHGSVHLDGKRLTIHSPRDAIKAGICLLTEDRKAQGLILGQSARENFALPNLSQLSRFGFIRSREERGAFSRYIDALRIKIPYQEQLARNLSGGNQQKLVLAKWLESQSEVILFDEPTRGVDVGAKYEIYLLINELAARGKVIVMISSELPEVLGMSDRILVMHAGRIRGEIRDPRAASQEQIMRMAVG